MDNTLLDQPIAKDKKPYWALASLVAGLLGTIAMFYLSYRLLLSLKGIQEGGSYGDPNSFMSMKGVFLGSGLALGGLYLVSVFTLVVSFVKEKSSVPRIFAIVGHVFVLASMLIGAIAR